MQSISPRNIPNHLDQYRQRYEFFHILPIAWTNGWLNFFCVPSRDSDVIVSAHLTERVLKDPNTSIIPANAKCIGFHPRAIAISVKLNNYNFSFLV